MPNQSFTQVCYRLVSPTIDFACALDLSFAIIGSVLDIFRLLCFPCLRNIMYGDVHLAFLMISKHCGSKRFASDVQLTKGVFGYDYYSWRY